MGGGVCGKKNFWGKTRFKSYLTINQSQKLKLIFFHIFLTASGEGGVNPSGQPDRFFPVFFLTTSLRNKRGLKWPPPIPGRV